ncbi:MAG TPA: riboflavin synthase [Candidatus Tyrphobacter sp.]
MFSGLVAYRGRIVALENDTDGALLRVVCEGVAAELPEPKDSIAIDGACLTATRVDGDVVSFDVVPETLGRTSLRDRRPNDEVNVEYALRVGDRLGGHIVYGHIDASPRVLSVLDEGQGKRMRIERPKSLAAAIVEKGFVAVDGVSLTVAAVGKRWFEVALIPETLTRTTLGLRAPADRVNLEIDPLARYARAAIEAMRR